MATPSHTHGSADLQNSYGPEVSATQHHASQGLEAVAADGLEALPGQRVAAPEYTPYAQQAEKNNDYQNEAAAPATSRKRALGLPFWGVWLLVGLVIIVLGVALGVGLGVGLSNRSSTSASSDASASSPSASPSITTTAQAETTSSTPSTATSSSSASATAAKVKICWNADLVYCNTISVPPDSCSECLFPAGTQKEQRGTLTRNGDSQLPISIQRFRQLTGYGLYQDHLLILYVSNNPAPFSLFPFTSGQSHAVRYQTNHVFSFIAMTVVLATTGPRAASRTLFLPSSTTRSAPLHVTRKRGFGGTKGDMR